ncbi:regulatory signaling modulator protein AmpE [SAR92 clade bacterium H455]|uniref:Regulatory signaling modulator protein AmpE n=1 Tax=SAR92 clade bacterium H455 TaxID=2974818 RepID=A0ABY5TQE0_9GAMM|nr:regulatory signaling modulator protein AmpE [SAR92 clade bacterium H455]
MHFLIILIAIAVLESNGQLAFIQRDIWVQKWHGALAKLLSSTLLSSKLPSLENNSTLNVLAFVLIPVVVLQLVLWYLGSGILVFLVELAVLLYCLGRGDLSAQIGVLQSDIQRNDLQAAFHDAAVFNIGHRAVSADNASGLFRELAASLPYRMFERSFVVVFWFFFLGAPVALAYRLLALHGDMQLQVADIQTEQEQEEQGSEDDSIEMFKQATSDEANKLLWYLEWIPVRALALTLGLMGDFSKATAPLKELVFCPKTSTADVLRRCVLGALNIQSRNEAESSAEVDQALDETAALAQVADIVALFRRSMTGWLVAIALLVLTS